MNDQFLLAAIARVLGTGHENQDWLAGIMLPTAVPYHNIRFDVTCKDLQIIAILAEPITRTTGRSKLCPPRRRTRYTTILRSLPVALRWTGCRLVIDDRAIRLASVLSGARAVRGQTNYRPLIRRLAAALAAFFYPHSFLNL